jgi:hypothetical protein
MNNFIPLLFFMKYILITFFTCICFNAFNQTQFEGKIIYKATGTEKNDSGYLTIYFSKPGIRLELVEAKRPGKNVEAIIINLDSGKIFNLNPDEKKFKESLLKRKSAKTELVSKTIAGFSTNPLVLEFSSFAPIASFLKEPVLHVANDLHYTVPDLYEGNLELVMVQKNKIVLGAEFFIDESAEEWNPGNPIEKKKNIFNVLAITVANEKLDPALFVISEGYTKREPYDYSMDSTTAILDTTAVYPADSVGMQEYVSPVKKKKSTPSKKKSSTKQNAVRNKDY